MNIYLSSDVLLWQALLLTVISGLVGVLGGFVGLALGTMRLPALLLMGLPAPSAAGVNIMVSSLSALTGSIRHLREGRVNLRIVLVMGIPAFVGAFIGGFGSRWAPEALLLSLAGLLVFWQGIEFLIRVIPSGGGGSGSGRQNLWGQTPAFTRNRMALEAGIGLAVGLLGGAVGLILGSIRLPALIRILRVDPRIAAGTNLFIGFVMGVGGLDRPPGPGTCELSLAGYDGGERNGWELLRGKAHRAGKPGQTHRSNRVGAAGRGGPVGVAGIPGFGIVGLAVGRCGAG